MFFSCSSLTVYSLACIIRIVLANEKLTLSLDVCSFVLAANVLVVLYTLGQIILSIMYLVSGNAPAKFYLYITFGCDQVRKIPSNFSPSKISKVC